MKQLQKLSRSDASVKRYRLRDTAFLPYHGDHHRPERVLPMRRKASFPKLLSRKLRGRFYYSIPEAGAQLGWSRSESYRAAQRRDIPVQKMGKLLLVPRREWDAAVRHVRRKLRGLRLKAPRLAPLKPPTVCPTPDEAARRSTPECQRALPLAEKSAFLSTTLSVATGRRNPGVLLENEGTGNRRGICRRPGQA
jgi:hypothetical protein